MQPAERLLPAPPLLEGTSLGLVWLPVQSTLPLNQHKGFMFIPGTAWVQPGGENWFMGIEPNAFGVVGAIVNFAVAFAVSKVTAAPPQEVQELVEHIRVPVGAGEATGH